MLQKIKLKENVRIDEFDTCFMEKTYLLSCDNSQWQISELLYNIILSIDGKKSLEQIYASICSEHRWDISEGDIDYVINTLLVSKGILEGTTNANDKISGHDKNLWLRVRLLKSNSIKKLKFLSVLFDRRLFLPLGIIGVVFQLWFILVNYNSKTLESIITANVSWYIYFFCIASIVGMWHELGHSSACLKFGVEPGNIGFAFYFIMPVFYSDVSKIWKLPRQERVIVDLGGLYFQSLIMSFFYLIGIAFNNSNITLCIIALSVQMAFNLNPFLKMDGYWVLSDFIGMPNLQENMQKFVISKLKILFNIKCDKFEFNIGKREKFIFCIYGLLSCFFMVLFSYWIITAFYVAIMNLCKIYDLFNPAYYINKVWWEVIIIFTNKLAKNAIYLITIFFFGRILINVTKKVISLTNGIIISKSFR